mmetsp:Transcript_36946/g.116220  ORF Transcript_36946/g.116220 Transcript_36946/m.116220 type:complete len:248 (+) Transcript_36946:1774-2517(+)
MRRVPAPPPVRVLRGLHARRLQPRAVLQRLLRPRGVRLAARVPPRRRHGRGYLRGRHGKVRVRLPVLRPQLRALPLPAELRHALGGQRQRWGGRRRRGPHRDFRGAVRPRAGRARARGPGLHLGERAAGGGRGPGRVRPRAHRVRAQPGRRGGARRPPAGQHPQPRGGRACAAVCGGAAGAAAGGEAGARALRPPLGAVRQQGRVQLPRRGVLLRWRLLRGGVRVQLLRQRLRGARRVRRAHGAVPV